MTSNLQRLNLLPANEGESELRKCCGSKAWARQVAALRPYTSVDELIDQAERVWWALGQQDWLEAFHSHPKIGEKKPAAETAVTAQQWSAQEQAGIENSAGKTLKALAELNREYEEKFGFIFIVCATGKSSAEMLSILRARLVNSAEVELRNAAAEQAKITELRLRKLVSAAAGEITL